MGVSGECAVKLSKSNNSHPCCGCSHAVGLSLPQQQQMATPTTFHHHHHYHPTIGSTTTTLQQHQSHNNVNINNNCKDLTTTGGSGTGHQDTKILAPIRSKMRVLKKLKRKMGLGIIYKFFYFIMKVARWPSFFFFFALQFLFLNFFGKYL